MDGLLQLELTMRMLGGMIMFSFATIVAIIIIVAWTIAFARAYLKEGRVRW